MVNVLSFVLIASTLWCPIIEDGDGATIRDRDGVVQGTLVGPDIVNIRSELTRYPSGTGRSLKFTGKEFLRAAGDTFDASSVTVEGWFKPDRTPAPFTRILTKGDRIDGSYGSFRIYIKSGNEPDVERIVWALNLDGKQVEIGTPVNFDVFPETDGEWPWVHIAASYDHTTGVARVYVDGKQQAAATFAKSGIQKTTADLIWGNRAEGDRGFVGWLDELRVTPQSLLPGELGYHGSLHDRASSKEKEQGEVAFEWESSRLGVSNDVPDPWTPIVIDREAPGRLVVQVAGKDYIFQDHILPSQILVGQREMLAAPMRLELDGRTASSIPDTLRVAANAPRRIALEAELLGGDNQRFSVRMEIEFDGVTRLIVSPLLAGPRPPVSSLRVVAPLQSKYAILGKVGGTAGKIEKPLAKRWAFPMWVGCEDVGLTMFAESNQFWVNPKPNDAFTVVPTDRLVEVSANFITAATVFKPDSRFEVFLQPTPIKPFPEERPELGFFHGAFTGMENTPSAVNLTYPGESILRRDAGTLDIIIAPNFDPQAERDPLLGREPYIREIFSVTTLGEERFRLCWSLPHGGIIADRGIRPSTDAIWDGTRQTLFTSSYVGQKETPLRLTLVWGNGKLRCFVNAELLAECDYPYLVEQIDPETDGKPMLRFGESIFNFLTPRFGSGFSIHGIRLLDHPRVPQAGEPLLSSVSGTLLLDTFEQVIQEEGEGLITRPQVGPTGHISQGGQVVDDVLQLWQSSGAKIVSCLDRVRDSGATTLVYHQGWSKIQSHYQAENPEALHDLIDACHERGLRMLLYFGFELSEKAPEFAKWHRRTLRIHPERPTPPLPQVRRDQKAGKVCYAGQWQDFITFAIDKTLRTYNADGVYLDAAMVPYPCLNELHGCGWRDGAGKLHATHPIHGYLQMLRRIHAIVKERGGLLTGNQATGPLWGYPDSVWVGEGYKYAELGTDPAKAIPLDEWRTHFTGRNFGTPGELLLYEYPPNWRRDTGWALAGLHGMSLRPEIWWKGSYLEKVAELRRATREYDWENAEFIGYWDSKIPVKVSSGPIRVSCYRSSQGLLLWLANTSETSIDTKIVFDSALPLEADGLIHDPIFKKNYQYTASSLTVKIAPYNWRMFRVDFTAQ